ncbi:uncharacterized protein [Ptychodera flava]|uniref:uncharacterized protein n=1 Tax=Ptychodera flava TaxID=63121 RepID=UPI00396A901A
MAMAPNPGKTSQTSNDINLQTTTELNFGFLAIFLVVLCLLYAGYRNAGGRRFVFQCANPQHDAWTTHLRDLNPKLVNYVRAEIREVFRRMGARGPKFCTDCVELAPKKRDYTAHMEPGDFMTLSKAKDSTCSLLKRKKGVNASPSPSKSGPPRKIQARESVKENGNVRKQLFTPQNEKSACTFDTTGDKDSVQLLKREIEQLKHTLQSHSETIKDRDETIRKLHETNETQYSTQEKRIAAIKTIAQLENENIYEDSVSLASDKTTRTPKKLLLQNVDDIMKSRNPVVTAAIDAFCEKKGEGTESAKMKSMIRKVVATECIYSGRNLNYISDFLRLVQSVVYSLSQSESVVDVVGHVIPGGSYDTVFSMLADLKVEENHAPSGLIEYAFDNEQRLFKTRYSRNGNKQVLEILTNTIVVLLDPECNIQENVDFKPCNFITPLLKRPIGYVSLLLK